MQADSVISIIVVQVTRRIDVELVGIVIDEIRRRQRPSKRVKKKEQISQRPLNDIALD